MTRRASAPVRASASRRDWTAAAAVIKRRRLTVNGKSGLACNSLGAILGVAPRSGLNSVRQWTCDNGVGGSGISRRKASK